MCNQANGAKDVQSYTRLNAQSVIGNSTSGVCVTVRAVSFGVDRRANSVRLIEQSMEIFII